MDNRIELTIGVPCHSSEIVTTKIELNRGNSITLPKVFNLFVNNSIPTISSDIEINSANNFKWYFSISGMSK